MHDDSTTHGPPSPAALFALAAQLEREGQYNGAKLLRAAADALVWRAAASLPVPTLPAEVAEAVRHAADGLDGIQAGALADALEAAAAAIEDGRVPLAGETPDPHVCRTCGEISMSPFAGRCPHCGAWPSTARRTRPIYWLRASHPDEAINLLRAAPDIVASLLADHDDDALATSRAPGEWSAQQVLEHLHNAQRLFRGRLDLLIAGGDPELSSAMVWAMETEGSGARDLFERFRSLRSEILGILDGVSPDAWWNTGMHEEWGRVSLLEQVSYFANHEPTHLAQLADAVPPPG
jgi:uncharacterized damage-inducible protein DinB/ribosomal protein L37E